MEKLTSFTSFFRDKIILSLFLLAVGLSFILWGLWSLNHFQSDNYSQLEIIDDSKSQIYVSIAGCIKKPGLYEIDFDTRLYHLVELAGGFTTQANDSYIEQHLNLASLLTDGQTIYIPSEKNNNFGINQELKNNYSINSASIDRLEELEGIGQSRATKIIENRPFMNIQELVDKKIIPNSVFENIKNKLIL